MNLKQLKVMRDGESRSLGHIKDDPQPSRHRQAKIKRTRRKRNKIARLSRRINRGG